MKIKLSELKKIIREELNEANMPYHSEDPAGFYARQAVEQFKEGGEDPEDSDDLEDALRGAQWADTKAFHGSNYESYLANVAKENNFNPDDFLYFVTTALENLV
jgi:hypothetical protein